MADPVQTNISQTSIPDYAKPYVQNLLGAAQATAFKTETDPNSPNYGNIIGMQPYQSYPGQRTADFTGMQQQAFQGAQNLGPSSQLNTATNMAQQAGQNALNTQYNPQQYGNAYQGIGAYNPGTFNQQTVSAPSLNNYQMSGPQQVNSQQFTGDQISQYMNPYLQQSLAPQMAELNRAYDITGNQAKGQATQAGAFGGSRQAIMQAENERNRNMGISSLLGQGYNNAYNQAANQFNTSNQQNLQAQMSNQGAGLTAGQANLNALLGVQSLGAGQNLAAQQANQQTNLATQQAQQAANQYGYGQQAINAQNQAQYGQAANALNAQQQQFGAGLGLQGQQTALTAAGALGNLGGTQFNQQTQALNLQNQMGGQQQQQQQNILNQQYQDFLSQKQYPYQQMGFMSDMLRGLPLSQTANTMYQSPGSLSGQIAGLGMGAYGLSQLMPKKDGGIIKAYADGGSVESTGNIESIVKRLSDQQLKQAAQAAQARGDQDELQAIQAELAMRASERGGMAGAFNSLPQENQNSMMQMAGGGIVAFGEGGGPTEEEIEAAKKPYIGYSKAARSPEANKAAVEASAKRNISDLLIPKEYAVDKPDLSKFDPVPFNFMTATRRNAYEENPEPEKKLGKGISDHPIVAQARAAAKAAGVPEEDFDSMRKRLIKEYSSEDRGYQDEMLKHYKNAESRLEENKRKAGYEALTQFGFGMAAQAAKPGQARRQGLAGLLESAGTASPILSQSMAESNKINEAAANNLDKMRMDQLRFDQSMLRNDRQAATQAAGLLQQDKKTEKLLELERQKIAMMGQQHALAGVSGIGKVVQELAQRDPKFAELPGQEQYKIASHITGNSFRTDAANQGRLAAALEKEFGADMPIKIMTAEMLGKSPEEQAQIQQKIDQRKMRIRDSLLTTNPEFGSMSGGNKGISSALPDNGGMRIVGVR
jgi:hypothetical protein